MKNFKAIKRVQAGFTLIELMIVVAIVAILVALALPAYQDYAIRAKVTECIDQAASAKLSVTEYSQTNAALPPTTTAAGMDNFEQTKYCNTMTYASGDGSITVTTRATGADGDAPAAKFTPAYAGGNITEWVCTIAGGKSVYLPASCRT